MGRTLKAPVACLLGASIAGVLGSRVVNSDVPDRCEAHLLVRLEPRVSNPRDPSFLSALVANPLYQLTWVKGNDSTAEYRLTGPATDYQCEEEITRLSRDAHLMDLKVLQPGAKE
jgi:hypothetical protein